MELDQMIQVNNDIAPRIKQGDIFKEIEYIDYAICVGPKITISKIIFPLVVVLTQDCDLEWDHKFREETRENQDKWLLSVLVAPLYNAEHVFLGEHLSDIKITMRTIPKKEEKNHIKNNEFPRYHYLEFPGDVPIVPSIIDFKHYFSINVLNLRAEKEGKFVCSISPLFREQISQRFAFYLSRIGLPEISH